MRAVIQRVTSASVEVGRTHLYAVLHTNTNCTTQQLCPQVDGEIVSRIGPGLLCLIGVKDTDTEKDADFM